MVCGMSQIGRGLNGYSEQNVVCPHLFEHLLQQHLHLDARRAEIQRQRGFQHGFVLRQEKLDSVGHELR